MHFGQAGFDAGKKRTPRPFDCDDSPGNKRCERANERDRHP
jgi:hypothetical protein